MYPGQHAIDRPHDPAFIMATSGRRVTFAEYEARANRLAHLFRDLGLQRLDHVALFMENNPRLLECEGAAERTGLYYTCVNSYLAADEVAYIVNDSEAQVFITSAAKRDIAVQLPALCPGVKRWLMVDGEAEGYQSYETAAADYPDTPVADEQLGAAMLYSSGTTGRPKGILRPLPEQRPGDPLPVMEFVKAMFRSARA